MSKNMTRKGLAFGATFALGAGLISGVPAAAAGTQDGSVTLLPNVGAEYVVRSGDVFDLKANYDASLTASNRFLKFLVEDSADKTLADIDNNGSTNDVALTRTIDDVTASGSTVTIRTTAAHGLQIDDSVTLASLDASLNNTYTIVSVPSTTTFTITQASPVDTDDAGTLTAAIVANGLNTRAAIIAKKLGSANIVGSGLPVSSRSATDNSYVVKGIDNDVSADQVLRLVSADTTTSVSVNVTAWIDNNGNDEIDATEKASPTRTVSFLKASDISATTTIRPATAGESTVVVDVVTSPVLNGLMILAAANENLAVNNVTSAVGTVRLTRQGDATVLANTAAGSYSNTTKRWTFTSQNFNSSNWADTAATKVTPGANGEIGTANKVFIRSAAVSATGVVTMVTADYVGTTWTNKAHGLRVGDKIIITDEAANTQVWESATAVTITSVPTTSSFTFATTSTTAIATTTLGTTTSTEAFWTVDTYVRNFVEAGTITAQFHFDTTNGTDVTTSAGNPVGALASYSVGAKVVGSSGLSIAGVATSTVNAAGKVAKAATTADFLVTVKDADGDAVGAGVDVTMTAQRTAGVSTITANGLAVGSTAATTFYGKTDANGQVKITLTNSAGAVGDTVALTANSQGATQATLNAVWEDKVYTIHDINDANYDNSVRTRSVAAGASYTITFLVQDQWKAVAGADVRLKVTLSGRAVQTSIVTLTNGIGTFTVADGGLTTGDTTVTVVGQSRSATTGLWSDGPDASFADWDGASGIDLATVAIKYQTASAINFNANGANFPSTTAADHTADVTTLTPVALDQRVSNATAPAFKAAEKAVVSGSVTQANGVLAAGSLVTVTGTGLAFKAGNVWALDSISFVTDGTFAVEVYSRTSGAKSVTVTSGAATKAQTVTFNAVASTRGYSVVLNTPASVQRGSTFKVEGQILDANGNGIPLLTAGTGAAATLQVSYLGLGLVSGVLPTTTDKDGKFFFYVLVGTNDVGTATVTASYDADGTGTTSAAATVSKTIGIGQAAPGAGTVNVGSFNGKLVVYAKDLAGARISWKVGGNWGTATAVGNTLNRFDRLTPRRGVTVSVQIYVNGTLQLTKSVLTR